jgi:hypothetical protein
VRCPHWRQIALLIVAVGACSSAESEAVTPTTPPRLTTLSPVSTMIAATTSAPRPAPTLPPAAPGGLCEGFGDPVSTGVIASERITEASGIVTSRTYPGTLWVHNDSGDGPVVYAADIAGNHLGSFEIDAPAFDWEDMAIGPGGEPDLDYLYLGDIGDNFHLRPFVTIYRIAEPIPDPAGGTVDEVAAFDLVYPDPGFDSEAILVDPVTGDLLLITKPGSNEAALIFRAPAAELVDGARINLIQIGSFPLEPGTFVTAADIDRTGAAIVLRGYNQVWLWARTDLGFTETFAAEPCRTPSTAEVQGEAIAFAADGFSYYTISEGRSPDINFVESLLP